MKNKVKALYSDIKPSPYLKEKCLNQKVKKTQGFKMISAVACAFAVLLVGAVGVNSYLTPTVTASPISFARAETIVNLTVKTHTPVTLTVENGLLCADGMEWEKTIELDSPTAIGWLLDEENASAKMTLQKSNGKIITYTLSRSHSGWVIKGEK